MNDLFIILGGKKYSINSVKSFSYAFLILGILLLLLSLFIMPFGIITLIAGAYALFMSYSYRVTIKNTILLAQKNGEKNNSNNNINEKIDSKIVAESSEIFTSPVQKKKSMNLPMHINECTIAYDYREVNIAIIKGSSIDYTKFDVYDKVDFLPEPENTYDSNAIKVLCNDQFLGYIYKGKIQDMLNDWINGNEPIYSVIDNINSTNNSINLFIAFYKDPFVMYGKYDCLKTKLIKTSKKVDEYSNRQDNISFLERGDKLNIDYDFDTETYIVTNDVMSEVGEINKNISEKIKEREDSDDIICLVEEITEDDNGKYIVNIAIYFK